MYKHVEKVGIFPGLGVDTPKQKSYTIMISTLTLCSLAQQTIEKAKPPSSLPPLGGAKDHNVKQ